MSDELTLAKLIDLSVGSPEDGGVNFSTLHTLLHIMVRKLGAQGSRVELLPDHQKQMGPYLRALEKNPSLLVKVGERDGREAFQVHEYSEEMEVEVENRTAQDSLQESSESFQAERRASQRPSLSTVEIEDIPQKLEQFERKLSILPTEEELQQYCSRRESLHPEEPLDFMSVASRLDKIEVNLGKLSATMSDVILEFTRLERFVLPYLNGGDIQVLNTQVINIVHLLTEHYPGFRSRQPSERQMAGPRLSIDQLPDDFYAYGVPTVAQIERARREAIRRGCSYLTAEYRHFIDSDQVGKEIEGIKNVLHGLVAAIPAKQSPSGELVLSPSQKVCAESHTTVQSTFHQKAANAIISLRTVQKEIDDLFQEKEERLVILEKAQQEMEELLQQIQAGSGALFQQFAAVKEKIERSATELQTKFDDLHDIAQAQAMKTAKDIDYLKNDLVKRVTRVEIQVLDRVDYNYFRTRVPVDQFERAMVDITRALKDGDEKLKNCEANLQQLKTFFDSESCAKVDRLEVTKLERNMSKKIGLLKLLLNKVVKILESNAAAGTRPMLGALRCLSCDQGVTMSVVENSVPINKLPMKKPAFEVDGALERRKPRNCGGAHTASSSRRSTQISAQKLRQARELVKRTVEKPELNFSMVYVEPKDPVYKTHL